MLRDAIVTLALESQNNNSSDTDKSDRNEGETSIGSREFEGVERLCRFDWTVNIPKSRGWMK